MKKKLLGILFALALLLTPAAGRAHEYDRDDSDYPLRYVAYAVHPFGIAAEYAVLRPIHWLVSRPNLCIIFGHECQKNEEQDFFEWE
jgi:hypothetical protein